MILLSLIWLLQDFAQLLLMGICMIPDVFLLTILFIALLPEKSKEEQSKLVWIAFFGGLLWDLRWTNLPGLTSAISGGVIGLACFIWQKLPAIGRTPLRVHGGFGVLRARLRARTLFLLDDTEPERAAPVHRAAAYSGAGDNNFCVAFRQGFRKKWLSRNIQNSIR